MNDQNRRIDWGRSAVVAIATGLVACAVSGRGSPPPDPAPLVPDEAGAPTPPDSCETVRCSRDLRKIVRDCDEQVVRECPSDSACGNGQCLDACAAVELSQGSVGCSFWTLPPDSATEGQQGSCFAALVANTWTQPVSLAAELGAEPLDISKSVYLPKAEGANVTYTPLTGELAAGEVAVIFLAQSASAKYRCPPGVTPAVGRDPITHGTSLTKAFRLNTSRPVSAYSIFPTAGRAPRSRAPLSCSRSRLGRRARSSSTRRPAT